MQLAEFQLRIAERWRERGSQTEDVFAQFFFYFAGVNALYFLWSQVDDLPGSAPEKRPGETQQIRHLLGKAAPPDVAAILESAQQCTSYFLERPPIERMGTRQSAIAGDGREGRKARLGLRSESALERLQALGAILYLVRSNLVHGSKMDQGDDQEVVRLGALGLEPILRWAIGLTRSELQGP